MGRIKKENTVAVGTTPPPGSPSPSGNVQYPLSRKATPPDSLLRDMDKWIREQINEGIDKDKIIIEGMQRFDVIKTTITAHIRKVVTDMLLEGYEG